MRAARSLAEWLLYQQRVHARSVDLELGRVRQVAQRLELLRPGCPVAIVGGTNGKGSTATCLAALLEARGRRTGLFTSPHLVHYNERIQIGGVAVTDAALVQAFERIEAARGEVTLTFFEYSTLAALELFRAAAVQAMVLEVGLGGRLDATNIIDADVAVLCSIGFDHRDWLGDTLEQIGAEKAGIFRAGRPVVCGSADLPESVWQAAAALNCPLLVAERQFQWRVVADGRWSYDGAGCGLTALPAPTLAGSVQYRNSATAITALLLLDAGGCDAAAVRHGLAATHLEGRLQIIPGAVEWVLDVAHNPPAAALLAAALRERAAAARTIGVVGMLNDKDAAAVAGQLDALIDHWIVCGIDELRGLSAPELQQRMGAVRGSIERAATVELGCACARELARAGDRVLVFGSFHVVGPALVWLGYT